MFLHLIQPDRKFLSPIQRLFESVAPGLHRYATAGVMQEGVQAPASVQALTATGDLVRLLREPDEPWHGVLIHGLPFDVAERLLMRVPRSVSVAWYVWGFEAYESWPSLRRALYLPETRRLAARLHGRRVPRRWTRSAGFDWGRRRAMRRTAARYDFCVAPFHEEHELFVSEGLLGDTEFHWGTYGTLSDYVDERPLGEVGDDVQVGNSASLTNNHLDALSLLTGRLDGSRRIILPLTYGNQRCRDAVAKAADRRFGNGAIALVDFVCPNDYSALLQSCGHVVMNHKRQQALGNIYAALWRGALVYMNDTSAHRAFSRLRFDVRRIPRSLPLEGEGASWARQRAGAARNRDLLREHLSQVRVMTETTDLLEQLHSRSSSGRLP